MVENEEWEVGLFFWWCIGWLVDWFLSVVVWRGVQRGFEISRLFRRGVQERGRGGK